jgi:hypothetical protein
VSGRDRTLVGEGADRSPVDRVAPAVRAYLVQVCGPRVAEALSPQVLARIAELFSHAGGSPRLEERVRGAVREAALGEVRRAARRLDARLRHVARGRAGHSKVPELLCRRGAGLLSGPELRSLYATLDSCPDCGRLAARADAAEWQLKRDLSEIPTMRGPTTTVPHSVVVPRSVAETPRVGEASLAARTAPAPARALPSDAAKVLVRPEEPIEPSRSRSTGTRRWVALAAAALVVGTGCDAAALLAFDGRDEQPVASMGGVQLANPLPAYSRRLTRPAATPTLAAEELILG